MTARTSPRHKLLSPASLAIAALLFAHSASRAATVDTAAPVIAENNWFTAGFGDVGYAFFQDVNAANPRGGALAAGGSVGLVRNAAGDQNALAGSEALEHPDGGTFTAGAWYSFGLANANLLDVATLSFGPGSPSSARIGVLVGASVIQAAGTTSDFPMSVGINGVSQTVTQGQGGSTSADWYFFDLTDIAENDTIAIQASWIGNIANHKFNPVNGVAISSIPLPTPTVTLSTGVDPVTAPYSVDVTFSTDVTGLEASDFLVTNGTASELMPAAGPASAYTVLITPGVTGPVTVELPAGSATDGTYPNQASNSLTTTYLAPGSEFPTVTLSTTAAEPVSSAYTVDVVFSEDVVGLDAGDFVVFGGTASDVSPAAGPASVYTVTITPAVDGTIEVTLPADSVLDVDDSLPNEASNTLLTDYIAPTIPSVELFNPFSGPIVSGPYTVEVFFSENVTGLEEGDFVVTNGTASMVDPSAGPDSFYTVLITPAATGLVRVVLPAGSVSDDDGDGNVNTESNVLHANNLPPDAYISGVLNLSGRDVLGLGIGESNSLFVSPKTFDSSTDLSLNDIPWTDGVLSGSFDLALVATGSKSGIKRGGKGAFGTTDLATGNALIAPGDSVTLDSLAVSDLQGDLAGRSVINLRLIAVYLGNETAGDGATINDLPADGDFGGDTAETMRNDIDPTHSAIIAGTGTGNGYSINGIDITFDTIEESPPPTVVSAVFNASNEFVVTFDNLDTGTTYELRHSPDIVTPFTPVAGTAKLPMAATDSFTDPSPTLPGQGFYQLWTIP